MVLQRFLQLSAPEIPLWELKGAGFKEGYFTSAQTQEDGQAVYICYDIGYILLNTNQSMVRIIPVSMLGA